MCTPAPAWQLFFRRAAVFLPLALLIAHLSNYWRCSPQYEYGWLVPPLAAYLLWRRWKGISMETGSTYSRGWLCLAATALILVAPLWWIRAAAPDWSGITYAIAACTLGCTFALIGRDCGWLGIRQFAFPVLFLLFGMPWPQRAENWVVLQLTQAVAAIATEVLLWSGIPAEQLGNLVSLPGGAVGISEACSGIRSIQSMVMGAVFLGEIRRATLRNRFALLGLGLALAFLLNVVRSLTLVIIAYRWGIETLERWHDPAGWSILLASMGILAVVTKRFGNGNRPENPSAAPDRWPQASSAVAFACVFWILLTLAATEGWYRWHERALRERPLLVIHWPERSIKYEEREIPARARDLTLCTEGRSASWLSPEGVLWGMSSLTWAPGGTSTQSARIHFPEVCLPAVGRDFVRSLAPQNVSVRGGTLSFRVSEFRFEGYPAFVFHAVHEQGNRDTGAAIVSDWSAWSRIQRAFLGQRNLGQQSLQIAVVGISDEQAARDTLSAALPNWAEIVLQ